MTSCTNIEITSQFLHYMYVNIFMLCVESKSPYPNQNLYTTEITQFAVSKVSDLLVSDCTEHNVQQLLLVLDQKWAKKNVNIEEQSERYTSCDVCVLLTVFLSTFLEQYIL